MRFSNGVFRYTMFAWSNNWYVSIENKEAAMCRKGENIRKRKDGRWEARYIKYREPDGKIHYGSIYGKSYHEVKDKRNQKISELPGYGHQICKTVGLNYQATFATVTEYWKQSVRYVIKDSTFSNYEAILKNQLLPQLGDIQIRKLTNSRIMQLIQRKKKQGLSAGTIHVTLSVLRNVLNFAAKKSIYTAEPICYPHISASGKEVKIMSLTDYQKLENFLLTNMNEFHFGLLLCMHTGIRVGELSGLRWGDIDFAQRKIRIQRTVLRIKNLDHAVNPNTGKAPKTVLYIGPPKTEQSNREIPLPDKLLFHARRFQGKDSTYILSGAEKCMEPRIIQRRYAALLKTCEIPPIKIHALRHQFSCRWVEHGFDTKSLSEILGHTSVRTTLDLYVHIQAETKRQYMNQMIGQAM